MSKHKEKGKLFVISGPSAVGKGTICKRIIESCDLDISISMTTREPRPGEQDGKEYFFVNVDEFKRNIDEGNLLEYAVVFGNMYGTPRDAVEKKLERGRNVVLEIDVQGGLQVKKSMPETVMIFILPPDMATLRTRMEGRHTETEDKVNLRLGEALNEIKLIGEYDYCVVNDDLDLAVSQVEDIIRAESCRVPDKVMPLIRKYESESR